MIHNEKHLVIQTFAFIVVPQLEIYIVYYGRMLFEFKIVFFAIAVATYSYSILNLRKHVAAIPFSQINIAKVE